jgi:hypothetical protein
VRRRRVGVVCPLATTVDAGVTGQRTRGGWLCRKDTGKGVSRSRPLPAFGKIFLEKSGDHITVQIDGSVLDGWPDA